MRYALILILLAGCTAPTAQDAWRVACDIEYTPEPAGQDYWQHPSITLTLGTGDCEDKALLLWHQLKQAGVKDVNFCVGIVHPIFAPGGHAWVEIGRGGLAIVLDPTQEFMQPRWMLSDMAYMKAPRRIHDVKIRAFKAGSGLEDLNTARGY